MANRTPSQAALVVKNLPANAGDTRDMGSTPGLGRSPGGGHDNPLWYSCLENPMDRGAWRATVHRVTKSWTRLKQLSTHTHTHGRRDGYGPHPGEEDSLQKGGARGTYLPSSSPQSGNRLSPWGIIRGSSGV